jgi:enoyl-CoA hydratase
MDNSHIRYELKENGIGYLTINRPEASNSFKKETVDLLSKILVDCKEDPVCRALIFTGAGDKVFCAGADLETFLEEKVKPLGGREWSRYGQVAFHLLDHLGKPSIAAINGLCMGGGLELALSCTFRIASEKARFAFPEVGLGFLPGWGGTQRATRLLGKATAMELILTGDVIDPERARAIGLISRVVPPGELMAACEALAGRIIRHSAVAVKVCMDAVHGAEDVPLEEGLILEANLGGLACASEDAEEGLKAWQEKRKPIFRGR